jgi:hypothetical protein
MKTLLAFLTVAVFGEVGLGGDIADDTLYVRTAGYLYAFAEK